MDKAELLELFETYCDGNECGFGDCAACNIQHFIEWIKEG